jgi:hypothetical protein
MRRSTDRLLESTNVLRLLLIRACFCLRDGFVAARLCAAGVVMAMFTPAPRLVARLLPGRCASAKWQDVIAMPIWVASLRPSFRGKLLQINSRPSCARMKLESGPIIDVRHRVMRFIIESGV